MALLEMKNISKSYSGNQVLKDVNLTIQPGEIHGLIGENGAGKSTLMNILFGMPVIHNTGGHEGQMYINGEPFTPRSPMDAMDAGIGMVHQEFMLIPGFTITENVKLNRENTKGTVLGKIFGSKLNRLDTATMAADTKEALDKLHMSIDEFVKIQGLPVGYMQFVEIAREIDKRNLQLLILDEPTAVLTESEAEKFLEVIQSLSDMGIAILFITHRLDEIKSVSNGITVLRDGEMVLAERIENISLVEMARAMVGRSVELSTEERRDLSDAPVHLELIDLEVDMPGEEVKGVSLEIKKGEIFGIGGLAGQGKIGVSNGIMGLYPTKGRVIKDGQEMELNSPRSILDSNITFLSEDRKGMGLLLDESIENNIAFSAQEIKDKFLKKILFGKFLDQKAITENANQMIKDLDIRCTSGKQHTRRLSGGNQQKVCIARALTFEPDILLISEPTRGIDIGAKKLVLDTLVRLSREEGMTVVMTSSELAELRQISDRIAIISDGKLQGIFSPDEKDEVLGLAMAGDDYEEVLDDA